MVMKVSVRPLRSRADELMMSPFRRIEVGAMVGARGAIMMVWSEVIQLAKSDVRARRGGYNAQPYYAAGHMAICSGCGCCDGAARVQHALLRLPHVACRPARRVSPSASVRLRAAHLSLSACRCRGPLCTCPRWGERNVVVYIVLLGPVISRGPGGKSPRGRFRRALPYINYYLAVTTFEPPQTGFAVRFRARAPRRLIRAPPARPHPEARSRTTAARPAGGARSAPGGAGGAAAGGVGGL
jgi:hypothetical protein